MTRTNYYLLTFITITALLVSDSLAFLTTPVSGNILFEFLSGNGGSSTQIFGLDLSEGKREIFTIQLGEQVEVLPGNIVDMGYFPAGAVLEFYNHSNWSGDHWAYSKNLTDSPTASDLSVFTDTNNSLGFGGSIIESVDQYTWILHMDDAASFMVDDDDNEMVIKMSIVPEPITLSFLGLGALCLRKRRKV